MSLALYNTDSLRFWTEEEIEFRNMAIDRIYRVIKQSLLDANKAWTFHRCEAPVLIPRTNISSNYTDDDIFITNHEVASDTLILRPETTPSSYAYANHLLTRGHKMPLCVWQSGKSFRRELSDGASASKLRFIEFNQLEFQCIYSKNTKADYLAYTLHNLVREISRFCMKNARVISSDRLPSYSEKTLDIEIEYATEKYREVVSISKRTDFSEDAYVLEFAIGIDRLVALALGI